MKYNLFGFSEASFVNLCVSVMFDKIETEKIGRNFTQVINNRSETEQGRGAAQVLQMPE